MSVRALGVQRAAAGVRGLIAQTGVLLSDVALPRLRRAGSPWAELDWVRRERRVSREVRGKHRSPVLFIGSKRDSRD